MKKPVVMKRNWAKPNIVFLSDGSMVDNDAIIEEFGHNAYTPDGRLNVPLHEVKKRFEQKLAAKTKPAFSGRYAIASLRTQPAPVPASKPSLFSALKALFGRPKPPIQKGLKPASP